MPYLDAINRNKVKNLRIYNFKGASQKESINKVASREKPNRKRSKVQKYTPKRTEKGPKKDRKRTEKWTEKWTENHQKLIEKLTEKAPKRLQVDRNMNFEECFTCSVVTGSIIH